LVKKAEAAAKEVDPKDADSAKYYVKVCRECRGFHMLQHKHSLSCLPQVMTKAAADDTFLTKETARLKKMMEDGSVKPTKKEQFGRRLNMLSSFGSS